MGEGPKKKGRGCAHTAREQKRPVSPGGAASTAGYPSAAGLDPSEWAKVQRALRRVTKSATVAGLMALSGAMFGGCMPAVRPDMRAMGPYQSNAAATGARSFDSGESVTETDISDPAPAVSPSQDQAPTTGRVVTQEDQQ